MTTHEKGLIPHRYRDWRAAVPVRSSLSARQCRRASNWLRLHCRSLAWVSTKPAEDHSAASAPDALRFGAAGTLNQVGQQAVGKALDVPPTITMRPGGPGRVEVTRDLVLEPYQP